jgi:hypothetical protein
VAHSLLPSQLEEIIRKRTGSYPNDPIPNLDGAFIAPSGGTLLLDDGDILLTVPNSEMKDDMKFRINIAFGEPEIVKGKPVVETIHQMREAVLHVINGFRDNGLL